MPRNDVTTDHDRLQAVWETDSRGENCYGSPSWCQYIGEEAGSPCGADALRCFHPEDRDDLQQQWQKSLATQGLHRFDVRVRVRRHDGEYRWCRMEGAPVKSTNGRVVKWVGTCTEIQEEGSWQPQAANSGEGNDGFEGRRALSRAPGSRRNAGPRARRRVCLGSLERRLFLVVFVGLLPLALLSFAILLHDALTQRRDLLEAVSDTARALASAVDSQLMTSIASLDALAASPRLAARDYAGLHEEAKTLLARRPHWANLVLIDPSVHHLMNARWPLGREFPPVVEPASLAETLRTGQARIGVVVFNPVIGAHAFAVRVPVQQRGEVALVLTAIVRPDAMLDVLKQQQIPEPSVVVILDQQDRIVARSRDHGHWVGKPASPDLLRLLQEGEEVGMTPTRTLDGLQVYTAFYRSAVTGWAAAVGIPRDAIDGAVIRSYAALGASITVSMVLGLLAAVGVGRSITGPMRALEQMARALGQGARPQAPRTALPEIRQVAVAMEAAHAERETLLQREREARMHAERVSKAKDEFLAMLGHELRNPLAAISTAVELLERSDPVRQNETANETRAIIRRQVAHLARLTEDLLDASRVTMGKIMLDLAPLDLAEVVRSTVATFRATGRLGERHQLTLSLTSVEVEADGTRLDQVVSNLLSNAIKYTPPPGTISICVRPEGPHAVLSVRDSGLGIEADLLPRVFDVFVQGRRSLDRAQGGLGIGLTLVRGIVQLHGGFVEATSEGPGKGSEFVVRLPAVDRLHLARPDTTFRVEARQGRRIVLVEDHDDVRIALRTRLAMEGHEVHEACDGPSGIETILRVRPEVALIDIGLPMLDGYQVAQAVREQLHPGQVRLIAITGYGTSPAVERGMRAGFDAYLIKPLSPDEVNRLIAEPLPGEHF
ncbi:ATP-binding protein [Caldimonas brevitalea]|uniref:histidine kinase n=1 Tax=Caldimonas brevitalea TaxID=413882 RepID=A0A0G3BCU6_9BURK|nr:ATP-binding protein [Caldimonas brevitalea]AKJ27157.1 chemotaxis protein methyltransferase CheR [Caldimonas brevitalea]